MIIRYWELVPFVTDANLGDVLTPQFHWLINRSEIFDLLSKLVEIELASVSIVGRCVARANLWAPNCGISEENSRIDRIDILYPFLFATL